MSRKRQTDSAAPFQTIDATARITGMSRDYIRRGVKEGRVPYVRGGSGNSAYMVNVNVPLFLRQLEAEAAAKIRGEAAG